MMTNEKLVAGHLVCLEMKNHDKNATGPEKAKNTLAVSNGQTLIHLPTLILKAHISMGLNIRSLPVISNR